MPSLSLFYTVFADQTYVFGRLGKGILSKISFVHLIYFAALHLCPFYLLSSYYWLSGGHVCSMHCAGSGLRAFESIPPCFCWPLNVRAVRRSVLLGHQVTVSSHQKFLCKSPWPTTVCQWPWKTAGSMWLVTCLVSIPVPLREGKQELLLSLAGNGACKQIFWKSFFFFFTVGTDILLKLAW